MIAPFQGLGPTVIRLPSAMHWAIELRPFGAGRLPSPLGWAIKLRPFGAFHIARTINFLIHLFGLPDLLGFSQVVFE
jgi:hypothetical protein